MKIDGKEYFVRFVVQMQPGQNGIHSQMITNVELYETGNPTKVASYRDSSLPARLDFDEISDTKLHEFFALSSENETDFAKRLKFITGWERGTNGKWIFEENKPKDNELEDDILFRKVDNLELLNDLESGEWGTYSLVFYVGK